MGLLSVICHLAGTEWSPGEWGEWRWCSKLFYHVKEEQSNEGVECEGWVHRLQFIDDMTCYDDSIEVCANSVVVRENRQLRNP